LNMLTTSVIVCSSNNSDHVYAVFLDQILSQ
jgi:hypothetical protein